MVAVFISVSIIVNLWLMLYDDDDDDVHFGIKEAQFHRDTGVWRGLTTM